MTAKKVNRFVFLALAAIVSAAVSACSTSKNEMPVVNDENCKHEYIVKIEDKTMREEFAGLCLRRGTFNPSPKRGWRMDGTNQSLEND